MPKDDTKQTTNTPPIIFTEDVLPPMPNLNTSSTTQGDPVQTNNITPPSTNVVEPKIDVTTPSPINTNVGSAAPADDVITDTVMPAVVTSSPKKKFAGGKVIATILGLFLLVGGIGAGVFLTQQNQNINEKASPIVPPPEYVPPPLNAPQADHTLDTTTDTYLGVENVTANPTIPSTQEIRCSGRICQVYEVGTNIRVGGEFRVVGENSSSNDTTTTVTETASCQNIKPYTEAWALISTADLSKLNAGDTINFCVTGIKSSGSFDKAKFTINGVLQAETTTTRPGGSDFCQQYVIPASTTTFNVTAQIHHVSLGWK